MSIDIKALCFSSISRPFNLAKRLTNSFNKFTYKHFRTANSNSQNRSSTNLILPQILKITQCTTELQICPIQTIASILFTQWLINQMRTSFLLLKCS